jgi:diacylglycerol kinase family enzyme
MARVGAETAHPQPERSVGGWGSLVIVNPNASGVRDGRTRAALIADIEAVLERRDGVAPHVVETGSAAETRPAVEAALNEGVAAVVGVGGDGTLRDIAVPLAQTGVPLGVVPAGTGNQLAAVLGVPLTMTSAVAAMADAQPRTIDLGEVTLRLVDAPHTSGLFTIGCGAGFDARLMATTPQEWKRRVGRAAYFLQALKLAASVSVVPYRITVDGEVFETDASVAMVGNMGQLVPGILDLRMPLQPDDGLLDLIVVGARGPILGMKGLVDQLRRTSLGGGEGSDSLRIRGRQIIVEADRPEPLQVDGDYVGEGSLAARVLPGGLRVLVPAGSSSGASAAR